MSNEVVDERTDPATGENVDVEEQRSKSDRSSPPG
jgi:hypothetical protein